LYRKGRAIVFHAYFPYTIDYPSARPAMVLRDHGFDVHVVELGDSAREPLDGVTRWVEPSYAAAIRRVAFLRPELLVLDDVTWMLLALPFARRGWVRASAHSSSPLKARAQRLLIKRASVVSCTNPWEEEWWGLPSRQRAHLPYPVDLAFWATPVDRDPGFWTSRQLEVPGGPVISYVAQLMRGKRQWELVRALAPVCASRPDVRLVLAGYTVEAEEETQVRELITRFGLEDQVLLLGRVHPRESLRQLYAWTSIHAINTAAETQCMVLYESLAARTPTLIPALPELTSAFPSLLAHRDDAELRHHVELLLDDPDLRARQSEEVQARLAWADVRGHDASLVAVVDRLLA
jgi:glycosyltransferase involved in cell wall biosynthesis